MRLALGVELLLKEQLEGIPLQTGNAQLGHAADVCACCHLLRVESWGQDQGYSILLREQLEGTPAEVLCRWVALQICVHIAMCSGSKLAAGEKLVDWHAIGSSSTILCILLQALVLERAANI